MRLEEKINDGIKNAMKAKDKVRLETLRNIKKYIIEAKTTGVSIAELPDEDCLKIIQKLSKQGIDSATIYDQQNRADLRDYELAQVAVLKEYLPVQMNEVELTAAVREIIANIGATSIKDMGKVMGMASKSLSGKAEGKDISAKVKELLSIVAQ
ncbi:MAG: GatB/YqeY domain-containing protein [Rikenellaceae bacterium]